MAHSELSARQLASNTVLSLCRVADVMTESPVVVRPTTDMTSAARLLLDTKVGVACGTNAESHLEM